MIKLYCDRMSLKKNLKHYILFTLLSSFIIFGGITTYFYFFKNNSCKYVARESRFASLPAFTSNQLSQYDGVQNESTYLAYKCLIYDVTDGKDKYYGEGKGYHYLVGRDSTQQLNIFGGDIIEEKYPVVGILQK